MSDDLKLQAQARALAPHLRTLVFSPFYADATAYTPTYLGGTTPGATTYTTQAGWWWRVGSLIHFDVRVTWTAATGTGNAQVSLPFTAINTTNKEYAIGVWSSGLTFANGNVMGRILENQAFFTFQSLLTNAGPNASAVEAAGDIIASGWFSVAA